MVSSIKKLVLTTCEFEQELDSNDSQCRDSELSDCEDSASTSATTTSTAATSVGSQPPSRKRRRSCLGKPTFNPVWKEEYLMWPVISSKFMTCIICLEKLTSFKLSTKMKENKSILQYDYNKKKRLVAKFENDLSKQQSLMKKATSPNELKRLAPYKLAFVLAKYKLPFTACEAFVSFGQTADPESLVFKHMASSRNTIASKTVELHQKVLQPELMHAISSSPYWSLMVDDSTDNAVKEQCGIYARFIDINQQAVVSSFVAFHQVVGHPTADYIYQSILKVIGKEGMDLPMKKLVGFTCDGASVMISSRQGVFAKLRREINPKLFLTHCPPHRLVWASKDAQKQIPDFVEKNVSDILKDSPTRRDQFQSIGVN